jgi:hypothetical protein
MKASMYISAETTATDSRISSGRPAPANNSVAPNSTVPTAAHHSRIRAAPPRRRASTASRPAATASTTKNSTTGHTAPPTGRGGSSTAAALAIQPARAPRTIHTGTGRSRLTSSNVKNGCPSSTAVTRPDTDRGGVPRVSRSRPSTNSIATEPKISMT